MVTACLRITALLAWVLTTAAFAAERVPLAEWTPLPPAEESEQALPEAAQLARDIHLGSGATDPRFVSLWWYGVSSFIASAGGHLFLFDAWEIVGAHKDYAPIGREDLARLRPEVIFVGHGHFDHAADAGYVAGRTGAVVVGSEEICATPPVARLIRKSGRTRCGGSSIVPKSISSATPKTT